MYRFFFQCCLSLISISACCQHSFQLVPSGKITICERSGTLLQAPAGAAVYNWEKDGVAMKEAQFRSSSIHVNTAGVYTVHYTDLPSGLVFASGAVEISLYPAFMNPTIWAPRTRLSKDEELYLTAPPGFIYQWYFNDRPVKGNQSLLTAKAGRYQLRITDENGCISPISKVVVIKPARTKDKSIETGTSR